jgi:NADH-quinone oxidoreductase subunit E
MTIVRQLQDGERPRPSRGARLCTLKEMSLQLAGFADEREGAVGEGPAGEPTLRGNRLAEEYGISVAGFDPATPIPTQADREAAKAAVAQPAEQAGVAANKPASDAKPAGDKLPGNKLPGNKLPGSAKETKP